MAQWRYQGGSAPGRALGSASVDEEDASQDEEVEELWAPEGNCEGLESRQASEPLSGHGAPCAVHRRTWRGHLIYRIPPELEAALGEDSMETPPSKQKSTWASPEVAGHGA
mmetsp:Transcript_25881/g.86126  ORF Transcript_25881/g.86126 Transcript_25881/m.86126 type:complete len:111 (-) Transcript_25881:55-387(-)